MSLNIIQLKELFSVLEPYLEIEYLLAPIPSGDEVFDLEALLSSDAASATTSIGEQKANLKANIKAIIEALTTQVGSGIYSNISKYFHKPEEIKILYHFEDLDDPKAAVYGDFRRHIVMYIDKQIKAAIRKIEDIPDKAIKKKLEEVGWKAKEAYKLIQSKSDNAKKIDPRPKPEVNWGAVITAAERLRRAAADYRAARTTDIVPSVPRNIPPHVPDVITTHAPLYPTQGTMQFLYDLPASIAHSAIPEAWPLAINPQQLQLLLNPGTFRQMILSGQVSTAFINPQLITALVNRMGSMSQIPIFNFQALSLPSSYSVPLSLSQSIVPAPVSSPSSQIVELFSSISFSSGMPFRPPIAAPFRTFDVSDTRPLYQAGSQTEILASPIIIRTPNGGVIIYQERVRGSVTSDVCELLHRF